MSQNQESTPADLKPTPSKWSKIKNTILKRLRESLQIGRFFIYLGLAIGLFPLALLFIPLMRGIKIFVGKVKLFFASADRELTPEASRELFVEAVQAPERTRLQQVRDVIGSIIGTVLKAILFPLYLWRLGLQSLLLRNEVTLDMKTLRFGIYPGREEGDLYEVPDTISQTARWVKMPDQTYLYTEEFRKALPTTGWDPEIHVRSVPHVIFFGGNATTFRDYRSSMVPLAEAGATVIGFDFSHFGASGVCQPDGTLQHTEGGSTDSLVAQGIAQVQRLLAQGVPSTQITLYGHSMGGGIATLVAYHFQQLGSPIKLFNDRSFSNITNVATGFLLPPPLAKHHSALPWSARIGRFFQTTGAYLLKPLIKLTLWGVDLDINAGAVFQKIKPEYRDYVVARRAKSPVDLAPEKPYEPYQTDWVIHHHEASIHHAAGMRTERRRAFNDSKKTEADKKSDKRQNKFFVHTGKNAHMTVLAELKNRAGDSGESAVSRLQALIKRT